MNYGDLKSHFNDLLNRSDITSVDYTLYRPGDRSCTTSTSDPNVERVLNVTITSQTASPTLPADFLKSISFHSGEYELERVSMRKYREIANTAVEGKPRYFVRQAEKLLCIRSQPAEH